MSMQYIRDYYGVPAKRGGRVRYTPCEGSTDRPHLRTIVSARGQYLRVQLDGDSQIGIYHPRWQIEYLDPAMTA